VGNNPEKKKKKRGRAPGGREAGVKGKQSEKNLGEKTKRERSLGSATCGVRRTRRVYGSLKKATQSRKQIRGKQLTGEPLNSGKPARGLRSKEGLRSNGGGKSKEEKIGNKVSRAGDE